MKTIKKIIFEDVSPETKNEQKAIEKIIKDVKKEKIDMSQFKLITPTTDEDKVFINK